MNPLSPVSYRTLFSLLIVLIMPGLVSAGYTPQPWKKALLSYINKQLVRKDGGYGWPDQPDAHLTPTYAVIGILKDIDQLPSQSDQLIRFVTTQHPQRGLNKEAGPSGTEMRDLVYQQIQSLLWLGADAGAFEKEVMAWKPQNNKVSNFEEHGYPVFIQELMSPVCRSLLNLPMNDIAVQFNNYISVRRRSNGSYNNAPVTDGGDGNILNTYWGILASRLLKNDDSQKENPVSWIRKCQLSSGAFTYQPEPFIQDIAGDVAYTWAAVKALQLLQASPSDKDACINYLLSLRNDDGGFGDKPGLPSTPLATFYAVDALKTLDAFASLDSSRHVNKVNRSVDNFSGLKVYTVQFEAHGMGSPSEAVVMAQRLGIHLWGCKNGDSAWIVEAQRIANLRKVPVTFFYSDESYGKTVKVDGLGTFSHILDYMAPATKDRTRKLDGSSWNRFRQSFVQPLLKDSGALILQITNNEPLARMILDESVKRGGYAAISTIHFGQNFLFWMPMLYQYRYQLPLISLQDAHGTESWWWGKELTSHRTLFLAKDPTYAGLMNALKNNWVVAVRHDSLSNYETRMLGGANGVQQFVQSRKKEWAWWNDNTKTFNDPYGVISVLHPQDSFEVAHPASGINIRVRCWWNGVRQFLSSPAVVLEQLVVDKKTVKPQYIEIKDRRGTVSDSYYLYEIPAPTEGVHEVKAVFRSLKYNTTRVMTEHFNMKPAAGKKAVIHSSRITPKSSTK